MMVFLNEVSGLEDIAERLREINIRTVDHLISLRSNQKHLRTICDYINVDLQKLQSIIEKLLQDYPEEKTITPVEKRKYYYGYRLNDPVSISVEKKLNSKS
jgi:hypothetical protein